MILTLKAFLFSFFFVLGVTPLLRKFAFAYNIVDAPDGKIKKQKAPVPYLGGAAIFSSLLISAFIFLPLEGHFLYFLFGLGMLFTLGLVDDLWVTTPLQKFVGQVIAAVSFLLAGFSLKEEFLSSWGNSFISFFWILSVVNAFNLVDVMDGLATLLALCATLSFFVFGVLFDLPEITVLLSIFLGSLLGFFSYNRPPARLYLGDAGALFIGGFLAIVPFFFNWGFHSSIGFLVPVVVLAVPLLEGLSLIIIRFYKNIPFYYGSPDHYCLYLLRKGWSKNEILVFSAATAFVLFVTAKNVAFGKITLLQLFFVSVAGIASLSLFVFSSLFSRAFAVKNVAFCKEGVAKKQ